MLSDERQEIPQAALNLCDLIAVFRKPIGKIAEALRFERGIVHDDPPTPAQRFAKRADELPAPVTVIVSQKLEVIERRIRRQLAMDITSALNSILKVK